MKKKPAITTAAFWIALFIFIAQLLGLLRDRLFAGVVGPGSELDVYFAAFRIPDLVFAVVASVVSVSVLVPFVTKANKEKEGGGKILLREISGVFSVGVILISGVVALLIPFFAEFLIPGFSPENTSSFVNITRIMLISPILLGFSNIIGSALQVENKFFWYALSPVVYNIGIIFGTMFLYEPFGVKGLAMGVVVGALLHGLVQAPAFLKSGYTLLPKRKVVWSRMKSIFALSIPRTLALAVYQIIFLIIIAFASRASEGAVSVLQFAYVLQGVPAALIGLSYSTAAFPALSRLYVDEEWEKLNARFVLGVQKILLLSLPFAAVFFMLRAQIVRVVLGTGSFNWEDTRLTAAALGIFVASVWAQSVISLFIRMYYAINQTLRPFLINASSLALFLLSYLSLRHIKSLPEAADTLSYWFRIYSIEGLDVLMLPLAFSISMILNAGILWFWLRKDLRKLAPFPEGSGHAFASALVAALIGVSTIWGMLRLTEGLFSYDKVIGVLGHGALVGAVGIACMGVWYGVTGDLKMLIKKK